MKLSRNIITIDEARCNGCRQCLPACPEQAIQMVETPDGPKARLVKEIYCDGLGACLGNCPTGALNIEERVADPYDDAATMARIHAIAPDVLDTHTQHIQAHMDEVAAASGQQRGRPCSCPSARILQWETATAEAQSGAECQPMPSALRQWPVQLHLVPPTAPYFKDADLLLVADCVPFAYGDFHQTFLNGDGRALAVGCPKLDDAQAYVAKLTQILTQARPKRITVVNMEVPCCFGFVRIAQQAIERAGLDVPLHTVTISIKGEQLT